MGYSRSSVRSLGELIGVLSFLSISAAAPAAAFAAGPGLPRAYQVQRLDSPSPLASGRYSRGMHLAGDVNRDGEEDVAMPHNPPNGQIFLVSGETGALLDTVNAPDPSTAGADAGFGAFGNKAGQSLTAPPFNDLGSCPGGASGQVCGNPTVGPADGVPDLLMGATGVDLGATTDAGRVYVIDGATRAILKRVDIPVSERTPLALTTGTTGFGREMGTADGQTGCVGNSGVGPCPTVDPAVEAGNMVGSVGSGPPELVIGARRITEDSTTAHPDSQCASVSGAICRDAGRAYIYRGEEIIGSNPAEILDGTGPNETVEIIKNPTAQADDLASTTDDAEGMGNDVIPIGDVGRCTEAGILSGQRCLRANSNTTPDGRPEVVIAAPGTDLPLDAPGPAFGGAGVAHLVDGATRSILYTYVHPEPQRGAAFSSTFEQTIAAGDLGESGLPDVFLGAPGQNVRYTASGRGYAMTGNFKAGPGLLNIGRVDDPTPDATEENFGGSSAGVGDLVGGAATPANELMVGASGPRVGPVNVEGRPIDVHFFNPSLENVLQSVQDPDAHSSSSFGDSIEPLGDLNEDGFLDFAVGAFRYSSPSVLFVGRAYIFRSDNSLAPGAPTGTGTGPATPTTPAVTRSGRSISLKASKKRVRKRGKISLSGKIAAISDPACERGQSVRIRRAKLGSRRFRAYKRVRSDSRGAFKLGLRPAASYSYRAQVAQSARCGSATSKVERVRVSSPRRRARSR
jgi:hypothetical protein